MKALLKRVISDGDSSIADERQELAFGWVEHTKNGVVCQAKEITQSFLFERRRIL
jgi:hypothetical protein